MFKYSHKNKMKMCKLGRFRCKMSKSIKKQENLRKEMILMISIATIITSIVISK